MVSSGRNFPYVPTVNIILIRRIDNYLPIRAGGHIFHFEISRREGLCCAAASGKGPQMNPSAAFPRKNNAVASGPDQLILRDNCMKYAAAACVRAPNFLAFACCRVGDSNGPRLPFAIRAKWEP